VELPPAVEAFDETDLVAGSQAWRLPRLPRGAALDCGDMSPLLLHGRQGESGSEFNSSRGQPNAKQKRRRAAAVQGVRFKGKSQARLEVQKCWGLTEPRC